MKRTLLLLYILILANVVNAQGISFEKNTLSEALQKAKKQNKLIFIDAYAVWCGPCKMMDQTTFLQEEVKSTMDRDFIAIKLDVERGEGPAVKAKYAIEGLPSFLFLDGDGQVVYREAGYKKAGDFLQILALAKNNVKRTADLASFEEKYQVQKNDPAFLEAYLVKLKSTKSTGYYEVLEQYLSLQKKMDPAGKEMVLFLNEHADNLIFGGMADKIYDENMGTTSWDKYVRKDRRQLFQSIPAAMAKQTTEYAIKKRDTSLLDLAIKRSAYYGLPIAPDQKERLLTYYYQKTNQGEMYKKLVTPGIDEFYSSLDVEQLKNNQAKILQKLKENPNQRMLSHALTKSQQLRYMVLDFLPFVQSESDIKLVKKWSQRVYDILPTEVRNELFFAKVQYKYGDKDLAIKLMQHAIQENPSDKNIEGWKLDLNFMKQGRDVGFYRL